MAVYFYCAGVFGGLRFLRKNKIYNHRARAHIATIARVQY